MLRLYVPFASCYRPPGSSAGEKRFSERFFGKGGPDLEGVRFVFALGRWGGENKGIRNITATWCRLSTGKIARRGLFGVEVYN